MCGHKAAKRRSGPGTSSLTSSRTSDARKQWPVFISVVSWKASPMLQLRHGWPQRYGPQFANQFFVNLVLLYFLLVALPSLPAFLPGPTVFQTFGRFYMWMLERKQCGFGNFSQRQ